VVIELRIVQFWSEIILVISNRTRAARERRLFCTLNSLVFSISKTVGNIMKKPFIDMRMASVSSYRYQIAKSCNWTPT